MRRLLWVSVLPLIGFGLSGCYKKHLLFEAESLSMTESHSGKRKLRVVGPVEEKWCVGDPPALKRSGYEIGMADQAIYKAQKGGKAGDFILQARVWTDSDNCAIVEGKLARSGGGKRRPRRRK